MPQLLKEHHGIVLHSNPVPFLRCTANKVLNWSYRQQVVIFKSHSLIWLLIARKCKIWKGGQEKEAHERVHAVNMPPQNGTEMLSSTSCIGYKIVIDSSLLLRTCPNASARSSQSLLEDESSHTCNKMKFSLHTMLGIALLCTVMYISLKKSDVIPSSPRTVSSVLYIG